MINPGSRIPLWIIALLAALCVAALAWTTFGFVVPFKHETGQAVLDTYFAGYDQSAVSSMQKLLDENEVANQLLHAMYFGPELVFPALLTALLLLVFAKLGPFASWRGRPVAPLLARLVYLLPLTYGIADYAENIASLVAFGDSGFATHAAQLLPFLTRLKFAALVICFILIVRMLIARFLARQP